MKKMILLLSLTTLLSPCAFCDTSLSVLDKIENKLYGFEYSSDTETQRLNRIEESVYGKTFSGQNSVRINKLKKDLRTDLIGQEIPPKEYTLLDDEDDESWLTSAEKEEAAKMDYPVINEMEQQVFNKMFKTDDIKKRLSSLESKTFGKTYENDDLSTRVERLKAQIKPKSFMDNQIAKQENSYYEGDVDMLPEDYHVDSYGAPFDYSSYNRALGYQNLDYDGYSSTQNVFKQSKILNISTIEKTLYKTKFEDEPMEKRLSRIESSVFGTVFANDTESERIARISSAINAQKSARRYDSNRFGQNMATAFQIGTLILMVLACIL
jgi:regulator of replication initiation timing